METEAVKINISLMLNEDIPNKLAIPPQIPKNALSVDDFVNFCSILFPPGDRIRNILSFNPT